MLNMSQSLMNNYQPKKLRRVEIPKPDGRKRPLGIPCIEDRIVQQCILQVLEPVCEAKFCDTSYGFRPNRSAENAMANVNRLVQLSHCRFVVDFDIKGFFDNVNHEWLMKFLEETIEDKNFLRYIVRFLKSGVMEDMKYYESDKGTPQGGLISPVLGNVYLHYVLDKWFEAIKKS